MSRELPPLLFLKKRKVIYITSSEWIPKCPDYTPIDNILRYLESAHVVFKNKRSILYLILKELSKKNGRNSNKATQIRQFEAGPSVVEWCTAATVNFKLLKMIL